MPHSYKGVYDCFDNFDEARQYYKRCRKLQCFKLSDAGVIKENPICVHCGNRLSDVPKGHEDITPGYVGNFCHYSPKLKKVACLHYICGWESLLNKIFASADRLY